MSISPDIKSILTDLIEDVWNRAVIWGGLGVHQFR